MKRYFVFAYQEESSLEDFGWVGFKGSFDNQMDAEKRASELVDGRENPDSSNVFDYAEVIDTETGLIVNHQYFIGPENDPWYGYETLVLPDFDED